MSITQIVIITLVALSVLIAALYVKSRRRQTSSSVNNKQVYVGNLAYRANEFQVREFFEQFGRIQDLKIVRDSRSRRSKGYGFVTFYAPPEAEKALSANGESFKGRVLVVRIAKER